MTVIAEVSLPAESFHLGQALATATKADLRLTQFVPEGNQLVPFFWASLPECDRDSFEAQVRDHARVADLACLDGTDEKFLYRIRWTPDGDPFLHALLDYGVIVEAGTCIGAVWTFRLRADHREALASVLTVCRAEGVSVSLESVLLPEDALRPYGLTEKQRTALILAYEEGYFDDPSGVSLADLGDQLGVSRQAVSARLDRAVTQLIEGALLPTTTVRAEESAPSARHRTD
jgi:predicted DNA binding protein